MTNIFRLLLNCRETSHDNYNTRATLPCSQDVDFFLVGPFVTRLSEMEFFLQIQAKVTIHSTNQNRCNEAIKICIQIFAPVDNEREKMRVSH